MSKERSDLLDKRDSEARETSGGESRRRTLPFCPKSEAICLAKGTAKREKRAEERAAGER